MKTSRIKGHVATLAAIAAIVCWAGCRTAAPSIKTTDRVALLTLTHFKPFRPVAGDTNAEVWLSPELEAPISWDQLVLSWNAAPSSGSLSFEVRAINNTGASPYYEMGIWGPAKTNRHSVAGQRDEWGEVKTDTLVLKQPASRLQVRVTQRADQAERKPDLRLITISLLNSRAKAVAAQHCAQCGHFLDVPARSQLNYEGGRVWCSPTAVSMVLAWWAKQLKQPELDRDVPEVARGVYDSVYEGTGNWSFNAAYAGELPTLRAMVVRLNDLTELERWIAAGVPPICSIDAVKLRGDQAEDDVGHLVVVNGFNNEGDVAVIDPWASAGKSGHKIIPREDFGRAWEHSHNTAYLIYPARWKF